MQNQVSWLNPLSGHHLYRYLQTDPGVISIYFSCQALQLSEISSHVIFSARASNTWKGNSGGAGLFKMASILSVVMDW
jgi:hypothetical protein